MKRLREILLHVCVVCGFICMIAKVLDWYNPYMDFSGHILFAQMMLYIGVVILALIR